MLKIQIPRINTIHLRHQMATFLKDEPFTWSRSHLYGT